MGMLKDVKSKGKMKAAQNWLKMAENAKTPEKQVEYYTKALDANPYNAEAWFRKGRILEKMGNFEEAKRCFDLAIEIDPDYQGLVGKKQYGTELPADYEERSVFPENRIPEGVLLEEELEEQLENQPEEEWIAESSEMSETAYRPPTGDESIFSSLPSKEDNVPDRDSDLEESDFREFSPEMAQDGETPLFTQASYEDTPQTDLSPKAEVEGTETIFVSPATSEADFWRESSHEDFKELKLESQDNTEIDSLGKNDTPNVQAKVKSPEGTESQNSFVGAQPAVLSSEKGGLQNMDIRIPISETIKFWAIGIVAMLIAFKVMTYI
ncbi:tetratricopeptide repeat protein [Methanolobus sp.]|uniref:tetratricopeptide repeat protein n=1 Tax=Methanolobus sp. TaxID=1874737 RepID=UPI0025DED487|nr:tetratricopeptide repeat protein [Methanolobus sp.]